MSLNLIGVIRHSTAEQTSEGRAGVDRQLKDIESVQRMTGAHIVRTIQVIESGALVRDNKQFQQMFRDLAQPGIDGVACSAVDRLVRPDCFTDLSIFDHFRVNGKKIYTPGSVIDPATQSGWVESTMRAMFSGMERHEIRRRTMGGKEDLRLKKRCVNGSHTLPRGVLFDKKTHVWSYDLDPEDTSPRPHGHRAGDALVIPTMFDLFVNRKLSYHAIASIVGNGWSYNGVRNTLHNPIWIGIRRYDKERHGPVVYSKNLREDGENLKYRRLGPRSQVIEHRVFEKGLISDELFERAQEELRERGRVHGRRTRVPRFLVSGLLRCQCGKPWYTRSGAGRQRRRDYYYCPSCKSPSLQREAVDGVIVDLLAGELLRFEVLQQILSAIPTVQPGADTKRAQASAKLDKQRVRLVDMYQHGDITREEFNERKRAIESDRTALAQLYPEPPPTVPAEELLLALVAAFAQLHLLRYDQQRTLLQGSLTSIIISGRGVVSLTISGGFLGDMVAKTSPRLRASYDFRTPVILQFPKPYLVPSMDNRRKRVA